MAPSVVGPLGLPNEATAHGLTGEDRGLDLAARGRLALGTVVEKIVMFGERRHFGALVAHEAHAPLIAGVGLVPPGRQLPDRHGTIGGVEPVIVFRLRTGRGAVGVVGVGHRRVGGGAARLDDRRVSAGLAVGLFE
jgi:hypothetical protein